MRFIFLEANLTQWTISAFLDGDDMPDPKLLSATASRMLNVKQKDVEYVDPFSRVI